VDIRTLNMTDAQAFQSIRLRALRDHPNAFASAYEEEQAFALEKVAQRLHPSDDAFTLGALVDEKLVGVLHLGRYPRRKTRHRGMISSMYVAPESRGRGVGATLLDEALQRARQMPGLEELILAVTVGNTTARSLYTRAGFTPSHLEKRYIRVDDEYFDIEWLTLLL
jgi:ribosomal protein S18 acetylase RimI-like enzyme